MTAPPSTSSPPAVSTVPPAALSAAIESGSPPAVLDVRSRAEFDAGHIPGAAHIPFWRIPFLRGALPVGPREPLVIYCGHGPRAQWAAWWLARAGFTSLALLDGHWSRWRRQSFPVER